MVGNLNPRLQVTYDNLWSEYEEILIQEEVLWYQKSRSKWLPFGDQNTRYFHGVTAVRRRKNNYEALQDDNGTWISEPSELEKLVTNYFKNLFPTSEAVNPFGLIGTFPMLDEDTLNSVGCGFTKEDIWWAVKNMGAFRAPGVDGLQAGFYQSQWHIVREAVCRTITNAFNNPSQIADLNETLITLIPNNDQVNSVKQFRPISLCNVSYKIITKLLAKRLWPIMSELVSPCQSNFIPKRHTNDNIIIAQ